MDDYYLGGAAKKKAAEKDDEEMEDAPAAEEPAAEPRPGPPFAPLTTARGASAPTTAELALVFISINVSRPTSARRGCSNR